MENIIFDELVQLKCLIQEELDEYKDCYLKEVVATSDPEEIKLKVQVCEKQIQVLQENIDILELIIKKMNKRLSVIFEQKT